MGPSIEIAGDARVLERGTEGLYDLQGPRNGGQSTNLQRPRRATATKSRKRRSWNKAIEEEEGYDEDDVDVDEAGPRPHSRQTRRARSPEARLRMGTQRVNPTPRSRIRVQHIAMGQDNRADFAAREVDVVDLRAGNDNQFLAGYRSRW